MPSVSQRDIPQDIIDTVLDELAHDTDTLKQCSTVSRSFFRPSCKHLFRSITLDNLKKIKGFKRLLTSKPEISFHIRKLAVTRDVNSTSVDDEDLARVLRMVPWLRWLTWGGRFDSRERQVNWLHLSSNLRSALVDLFRSPSLISVNIFHLHFLPASILSTFTYVKRLTFHNVYFDVSYVPTFALARLESLSLHIYTLPSNDSVRFLTLTTSTFPNLRHLSIKSRSSDELQLIQAIITSSAQSVERVYWMHSSSTSTVCFIALPGQILKR